MKYTNKYNLPDPIVKAVTNHNHKSETYSASMLTKPARMVWLERRHFEHIEKDAIDNFWALLGTAVHNVLESHSGSQALSEEYLTAEINGVKVSGMSDIYENKTIMDYKTTSVWTWVFLAEKIAEYESQLNTYAYLFRNNGFTVDKLTIVMIFRDWMQSKATYDTNYPQAPIAQIDIKLWTVKEQLEYLQSRVDYFEKYKDVSDNDLPECSEAERWAKPSKWAVMKEGRKSAVRVLDDENTALHYITENNIDNKHYVEERKADLFKRCEYCNAAQFCNQYQDGIK